MTIPQSEVAISPILATSLGRRARWEAVPLVLLVLGLFYYWFAVADRYAIFLYGHVAQRIPLTQPFDAITSSRYWMAGLVAAGVVMIGYTAIQWMGGLVARWQQRVPVVPPAWQLWLWCSVPVTVGILWITMTRNTPTLPLGLALHCVASTLAGLYLALLPGAWAATRPRDLLWLVADGMGLLPCLLLLRTLELPSQGVIPLPTALLVVSISLVGGLIWLGLMSGLRQWRRLPVPTAQALVASGLGLSYLLLPVLHYTLATPPAYRYISNAANFFATNPAFQGVILLSAAGVAMGVTRLRQVWRQRRES
ncbi:MAG: hypothetical protein KF832_14515 [Caldilineaceae bacterium]|nr:hypothetical protein [Caldilineaceae bacterium]